MKLSQLSQLSLRSVDARDAALWRRLGSGRRLLLSGPGRPAFTLTLTAAEGDSCDGDVVDLAIAPGPLRLFDAHGLLCLLGSVAPPAEAARLPLAVHLALSRWPRALTDVIGMPSRSLPDGSSSGLLMRLTLQHDDVCERAVACAPVAVWERFVEAMAPMARAGVASLPLAWPLPIGRAQLSLVQLRGLDPGDVVRLREGLFDTEGRGILAVGDLAAQVRLVGMPGARGLQVLSLSKGISAMPDSTPPSAADVAVTTGSPVDTLALTLVAELGTVRSTVGELQGLAAGCVLAVGERHPGEVTLRVQDGQVVAHGELVDVGGRIGVRINRLASLP